MNLHGIFTSQSTKTAAEAGAPTAPSPRPAARSAVQEAVQAVSAEARTKIAAQSGPTPMGEVEKIAAEVAARDHQQTIKEAHAYGAAICDGFMAQLSAYEKVAAEQVAETRKEAEQVYDQTAAQIEARIHKVASEHYLGGYEMAKALLA